MRKLITAIDDSMFEELCLLAKSREERNNLVISLLKKELEKNKAIIDMIKQIEAERVRLLK